MTGQQKEILKQHLDNFASHNGGCLLCKQKSDQFYYDTGMAVVGGKNHPVITLYGVCNNCDNANPHSIDVALEAQRKTGTFKLDVKDESTFIDPLVLILHFSE